MTKRARRCAQSGRAISALPSQRQSCKNARRWTLTFSLLFAHSFPVTPKSFPVNFDNEFRLKPARMLRLLGDAIVILSPNFRFSLYFSLLFRNFELETGSNPTASSASALVSNILRL